MTGIENLVNRITQDAKVEADKIINLAKKEAEELKRNSDQKLEKELEKMRSKASNERDLIKERLKSNAQLKARNNKLATKQEVIKKVFDEVIKEFKNMSDDEYVNYIKKHISNENSKVIVVKDKYENIKEKLPNLIVEDEKFVSSGFIEVTQYVENNYTFESKLSLIREEIEGQLAEILYGNE